MWLSLGAWTVHVLTGRQSICARCWEMYESVRIGGCACSLLMASVFSREPEAMSSAVSEDKEEALGV